MQMLFRLAPGLPQAAFSLRLARRRFLRAGHRLGNNSAFWLGLGSPDKFPLPLDHPGRKPKISPVPASAHIGFRKTALPDLSPQLGQTAARDEQNLSGVPQLILKRHSHV